MCDDLITPSMPKKWKKEHTDADFLLVNPVPGLLLSKQAEQGLICTAKGVSHFCISNTESAMKDLFIIYYFTEFL